LIGAIAIVGLIDMLAFQTSDDKVAFNQLGLGFHVLGNFGFFFARLILFAFVTLGHWGDPFPYDVSPGEWSTYGWLGWVVFAVCAALSTRDKRVLAATVWMSATILPYLFSTNHMYFTRYWYLPAAGASILYAIAILGLSAKARSAKPVAVFILLTAVGYFAITKAHTFEGRYLFHASNYYLAHKKEPEIARRYYLRVIDGYGYNGGLAYSQLGVSQTRSGRAQETMISFKRATELDPDLDIAFRKLGTLQWKDGNSEGAVESFEKAIALDQDHTGLLPELGSELIRLEKGELAIRVWEAAVQYWPEQSEPLGYLGVSLYNAGKQSEARESWKQPSGSTPTTPSRYWGSE